jgi:hypothetical protein
LLLLLLASEINPTVGMSFEEKLKFYTQQSQTQQQLPATSFVGQPQPTQQYWIQPQSLQSQIQSSPQGPQQQQINPF